MPVDRIQRINEMLRRELAIAVYHLGRGDQPDPSAISFVQVETARDLRGAMVHVSFLAPPEQHADLLRWLRRRRIDFQAHIARTLQLKYTPKLMFRQTASVAKGDRVLGILAELPDPDADAPAS